jgi:hypothetical protein
MFSDLEPYKKYTGIMAAVLDYAISHPDILRKAL